jgi:ubiquitin-like-conjugating enzyme ATG3
MSSAAPDTKSSSKSNSSSSSLTWVGSLRAAREWAMPTLKTSAFLEQGVLTPEEFVRAGDELVFRCPTWSWEGGDPQKSKPYLPADKQYLVTRRVPCPTRVAVLEQHMNLTPGNCEDDEGDWLISNFNNNNNNPNASQQQQQQSAPNWEDDFDLLDDQGEVMERPAGSASLDTPGAVADPNTSAANDGDEDDEYAEMADYEDDNVIMDHDTAGAVSSARKDGNASERNSAIRKVRTYDLSITYDKYYQTPRVWMVGQSAEGQPLSGPEMMEDVMTDYANKTVTIEGHPHVSGPHASIHPCQHGKVMKTIVRNLIRMSATADNADGNESAPSVESYLFIFLKFVSSIIPTINYDFTMDVTAPTR